MAVVQDDGVFGLPERADGARLVGMVALAQVSFDLFQRHFFAFGFQLLVAPLRADRRVGRHEDFQFGVREYDGADIASVHHDPFLPSQLLLLPDELLAYGSNAADFADQVADFDAANPFFDVFAVQEDIARSAFGVECERDLYLGKHRDQQRFVHVPVLYGAVPQAVQRYGPVHRSGVDEYVADPRGDLFRKSAFAAR